MLKLKLEGQWVNSELKQTGQPSGDMRTVSLIRDL